MEKRRFEWSALLTKSGNKGLKQIQWKYRSSPIWKCSVHWRKIMILNVFVYDSANKMVRFIISFRFINFHLLSCGRLGWMKLTKWWVIQLANLIRFWKKSNLAQFQRVNSVEYISIGLLTLACWLNVCYRKSPENYHPFLLLHWFDVMVNPHSI